MTKCDVVGDASVVSGGLNVDVVVAFREEGMSKWSVKQKCVIDGDSVSASMLSVCIDDDMMSESGTVSVIRTGSATHL